ncbi:glycine cleavage system protein GcvH [Pseudonocardia nigra]|uniref:glycine cleavage system protein GcvH n=1 Tax=Pseudonocardia nigra TaxID=1921578 RepID=UPI001C604488|nr:glycine cleavage system protein GcvH [Pseudonocardia nigra]
MALAWWREDEVMQLPEDLRYTEQHQWLRLEPGGTAVIGITDFAQEELGEIVYVDHPNIDDTVEKGQAFGEVESNKTASEVYAPCSGRVVAINEVVDNEPERLNTDPYGEGWIIKVQPQNHDDFESLLDADAYRRLIEG